MPLLLLVPGLWRQRFRAFQWLTLVIMPYVAEGAVRGMSDRGLSAGLGWIELTLASRVLRRHRQRAWIALPARPRGRDLMNPVQDMNPVQELQALVGASHVLTQGHDTEPYLTDWRKRYLGKRWPWCCPARPRGRRRGALCAAKRSRIVPQGGNTGLCGGATPDDIGRKSC